MKKIKKPPMKKARKRTTLKEDVGKYLLDISKLIFGSVVLGRILQPTVIDERILQDIVLTVGLATAIVTFVVGLILVKKEIPTEKTLFRRKKRSKR